MKKLNLTLALAITSITLIACSLSLPSGDQPQPAQSTPAPENAGPAAPCEITACNAAGQPVSVRGRMEFTNNIILDYYVEHAVALVDMHGFVIRDERWDIRLESQTLGYIKIDAEAMTGEYQLQLPARPQALADDVDNDGQKETGVQTFAVTYWPNLYGDPYSVGDDVSRGWPSYLASVKADTENQNEITGGKLVVWAPDDKQSFPSGFGVDSLLFTADDPAADIPSGYSIVDLDQQPFAFTREEQAELTLYEPSDVAVKDFSELSYSQAFEKMFNILKKEYAFADMPEKSPDWDALWADVQPRVAAAEAAGDPLAYYQALADFTYAFKDGHVFVSEPDLADRNMEEKAGGGLGFAVRELDDGQVIVTYVDNFGPARNAGIKLGAVVTKFNNLPISDAIGQVRPLSAPNSTEREQRFQQTRYLLRSPEGTTVRVTFENPGEHSQTAVITSVAERDSLYATDPFQYYDPYALPVEAFVPDASLGYVRVNSNYDDLNLILRLFERALKTFEQAGVTGVIIDLRANSGGASLGLAAFLTEEMIPMSQLEYYSEKTGQFEPDGPRGELLPNENIYHFDKVVTLVGPACYSACEIEAYGLSQVKDMIVMGQAPTAGVEAEVARGQFTLPEGITLQAPTGRFTLPDGSIFLEGEGVPPTIRIPVDYENVMAGLESDVVFLAAAREIWGRSSYAYHDPLKSKSITLRSW
ncbi:MAG: S41 family peptidase [Anaerolineaceae bacterium]